MKQQHSYNPACYARNKASSCKINTQNSFYPDSTLVLLQKSMAYSGIFYDKRVPAGTQLLHKWTCEVKTFKCIW